MTTALVTGVGGQDGTYLARQLVGEGVAVVGTVPPSSAPVVTPYLEGVTVVTHDVRDTAGFRELVARHRPDEVYNLAGFSSVGASWDQPELVESTNAAAVEGMLQVLVGRGGTRFFQASSPEEYASGAASPYARSKSRAHALTTEARDRHGLFACAGVLYNHESPLRGRQFVTRKITRAAAEISSGRRERVRLGNLSVTRDWGHARDYVRAMTLMLRNDQPADFVVATGVAHTLEDLLNHAFASAGLRDAWRYVEQDPALIRPADSPSMVGDATPIRRALGWSPTIGFEATIAQMVAMDVRRVETGVEEHPAYLG